MKWTSKEIVLCSSFISLWFLLASSLSIFRPLFYTTGFVPVFYILIWIQGFYFPPKTAFVTGFLGHAIFDMNMIIFDFFFIFIWLSSGICCLLISCFKKTKLIKIMIILMPIINIIFLMIMAELKFFSVEEGWTSFIVYLKMNWSILIIILFVNPVFNIFVYIFFVKNKIIEKFFKFEKGYYKKNKWLK